jgi:UDP-2-acetamido-2,6-beta-L-arabino-hexul-4-ose reductase
MSIRDVEIREDDRGKSASIFGMGAAGEVIYASIIPGKIRGNHYHKFKKELFCVIEGIAKFKMRNIETGEKREYKVSGDKLQIIEIFPLWTHSVENIGNTDVKFIEWANMPYNPASPDSFSEAV